MLEYVAISKRTLAGNTGLAVALTLSGVYQVPALYCTVLYCTVPALAGPLAGSLDHLQLGGLLPVLPHLRRPLPAARVIQVAPLQGAEGQSKDPKIKIQGHQEILLNSRRF